MQGLRKNEILKQLESGRDESNAFVTKLRNCARTARACLESLGLSAHPEVLPFVQDDGTISSRLPHSVSADVIYRTDAGTQFQNLPDFPDPPPATPPPMPPPAHQFCFAFPPPARFVYCFGSTVFTACAVCTLSTACAATNSLIIQFSWMLNSINQFRGIGKVIDSLINFIHTINLLIPWLNSGQRPVAEQFRTIRFYRTFRFSRLFRDRVVPRAELCG